MTKRDVQRGLEELSDTYLRASTVDERLELTLEAVAAGKSSWVTQLIETCPRKSYTCVDMAYRYRVSAAHLCAMEALYDLETAFLRFLLLFRDWNDQQRDALLSEDEPGTEADGVSEEEVARRFADCLITYRAYDRFATSVLGVELGTWLSLHPNGPGIVDDLETVVAVNPALRARVETDLNAGGDRDIRCGHRLTRRCSRCPLRAAVDRVGRRRGGSSSTSVGCRRSG